MERFTDTQLRQAKQTDLERYLTARGETLKRSGGEFRWVYQNGGSAHDSVTVRGSQWFDHRRQMGGDAIGFLQEFMGLDFRAAVAELLNLPSPLPFQSKNFQPDVPEKKVPLVLPPRNSHMRRLYAYLCKTRCIPHEIVTHFVRAGTLYEDADYHNAVFLSTDQQGKPVGGMKKATHSGSAFRQTISGSDTRYGFHHRGDSEALYVFEGAVDLLSFLALYPQNWQQHSYLALDGVSSKPLHHFLKTYPNITAVRLCLDNDAAGIAVAERIGLELREAGNYQVSQLLSQQKDWNEDLTELAMPQLRQESPALESGMG